MGDVVYDTGIITKLDMPAERTLKGALEEPLECAVVLGWREDGSEYFSSSLADAAEVIFLLELYKFQLLEMVNKKEFRERPDGCA